MPESKHVLKTDAGPFARVWDGRKRAEFRRLDRDFLVFDRVTLLEVEAGRVTGRRVHIVITDIEADARYGVPEGYGMLSFRVVGQDSAQSRARGIAVPV